MCGLDDEAENAAFPKWFQGLFVKNQDETYQAHVISNTIERNFRYEDSEVPLYPALVKIILTCKWSADDLGKCPAYINAAAGLSPYTMVDLSNYNMACIQQELEDIFNESLVSTFEFKAARSKLLAQTPEETEAFMLMIKRFTKLILIFLVAASPSTCN